MAKSRDRQIKRRKQQAAAAGDEAEFELAQDEPRKAQRPGLKIKKKKPRVSLARMKAGRKGLLGYTKAQ